LRTQTDVALTASSNDGSAPKSIERSPNGKIIVRRVPCVDFNPGQLEIEVGEVPGDILYDGVRLRWQTCFKKGISFPAVGGKETFDFYSIGSKITVRHWRPGDRFQPIGMTQAVKLQDLFTNAKVPRSQRHARVVAATSAGQIFWVEGMRIAERFQL